jgi:hypothetical protein
MSEPSCGQPASNLKTLGVAAATHPQADAATAATGQLGARRQPQCWSRRPDAARIGGGRGHASPVETTPCLRQAADPLN